ncbi:phage terminase small subunit [Thermaerobacillus caldiproteolyticus]|uniref:phage terminase small subunit n=1 Tax=Thermaerobacillus caldiproteolyticus TaxID=247480 RepID=UPI0018F1411B|nr:phage terminase small subunit [Anoxybacillus caldiproteolyticus]
MAEKYILAEKDYVKGMKYKDIAEKYGVSINTVKSWKKRYGWSREKGAPSEKSVHTKKRGAPKGNINAKGNKGGAAPKGNQNALKHGFFSKYLPQESLDIMEEIQERSPIDLLWDQIMIQYTAIIRAQKIMFVESKDELIKELKRTKESFSDKGSMTEEEYEFQFAWDRHATFLNAQSRAMSELRSLIKQFEEMASMDDERRLKLEQMRLAIEKTKVEIKELTQENEPSNRVVIVNDLDEMRKVLNERNNQNN